MKKRFLRILSSLLVVVMIVGSAPLSGFVGLDLPNWADIFTLKADAATKSGTCGDNLTWSLDTDTGVLEISGTGDMYNWNWDGAPWHSNCSSIKTVEIGNSVKSIGDHAFDFCTSLISVTIPDSVTSIGYRAFYYCTSLTSVTIPDSVKSIGNDAFYNTRIYNNSSNWENNVLYIGNRLIKAKSSISGDYTIKSGTKTIADEAFYKCTSLTSVTISDSVTSIGNYAFYRCTRLTSVIIGNSVTSIGYSAFEDCTSLTSVTIPDSVTSIGSWAFEYCRSLTSVTIPDSVTSIGDSAFSDCDSLTSITVKECNPNYSSNEDGALFNKDKTELIQYPAGNTRTSYTIPNSVTSISYCAFTRCSNLTSVTIPDSVTSIGEDAFYWCKNLTSVTIPDSVTSIGKYAFYNTGIYNNSSNWENNVLYIGNHLIEAKSSITGDYIIKSETKIIADEAFYDCDSLTSVTIGDSVTSIGGYAFYDCDSLTSISIGNSVTSIGSSAFYGTGVYNNASNWENNVLYIGNHLIGAQLSISGDYEIKSGTKTIAGGAFEGCRSLTGVTIPDSVTSIGERAFHYCTSLTSITVDSNNGYYSSDSFGVLYNKDKTELIQYPVGNSRTSFTIPDSVTSIGDGAFSSCDSLTSVTIPDSVTSIGDWTFSSCDSLTSVTIPDSVRSIGKSAFYDCNSLTNVTIPDSVTFIGNSAFYNCTSLTDVYYTGTEEEWYELPIASHNGSLINATIHYSWVPGSCVHSSYTDYTTLATCVADGESYKLCNDCGENFDLTVIPATGKHTYTSTVTAVATCRSTGAKIYTCTACDYFYTETIAKDSSNHTGGTEIINAKSATCNADGYTGDTYCKGCSAVLQQGTTITALGHEYGEWATVSAPDCLNEGVESRKCTRCSHEETRTVFALGHIAGEWVVEKEATYFASGEKIRKCVKCGAVLESAEIPQLELNMSIPTPSTATVKYGDSIILHTEFEGTLSDGAKIEWTADNDCFSMVVSEDGTTCEISPKSSGKTTFTVTVYDADGNEIASSSQEMTSKAGFFNKFIAFFKKIFGLLKVIPYTI